MQNIFVGNLSPTTTEQNIRVLFESFGEVLSVKVVVDRDTSGPRGIAFVEMANPEEANRAITAIDQTVVDGSKLSVNEARPKTNASDPGRGEMRSHRKHRY